MMRRQTGFTLIELLVVMVVLGLIAGIGVANLGGGNLERELQNEANRIHALLRLGSEEAIMSNDEIGVYLDKDQYGFVVYSDEGAWEESPVPYLKTRTLPEWAQLDFRRLGDKREIPVAENDEEADPQEESASRTPDVMLLSSGEVTGFVIGLEVKDDPETRIEIRTDDKGNIIFGGQDEEA